METLPAEVHRGMRVLDRTHKEIGTVKDFKMTGNAMSVDASDDISADEIALLGKDIPEGLRRRLIRQGFVRLDTNGLFAADRLIMPEQIEAVADDQLMLSVSKDELLKRH